jgi:hypothetical protein
MKAARHGRRRGHLCRHSAAALIIVATCALLLRLWRRSPRSRPTRLADFAVAHGSPVSQSKAGPARRPSPLPRPTEGSGRFHERVHYYVHGSSRLVRDAAAPALAAAGLGVATAAPVVGLGHDDVEAVRAKSRLVVLNASVCESGAPALATELQRQLGPGSPVERQGALAMYVADACAVAPPTSAAYVVGDVATCFSRPVFAKARPCGCSSTVLLDLNRNRHFDFHPVSERTRVMCPARCARGDMRSGRGPHIIATVSQRVRLGLGLRPHIIATVFTWDLASLFLEHSHTSSPPPAHRSTPPGRPRRRRHPLVRQAAGCRVARRCHGRDPGWRPGRSVPPLDPVGGLTRPACERGHVVLAPIHGQCHT